MNLSSEIKPNLMVHVRGNKAGSMKQSEGMHVGTVDHLDGKYIKLKKNDSEDGAHHWIPLSLVESVDDRAVHLNATKDEFYEELLDVKPFLQ